MPESFTVHTLLSTPPVCQQRRLDQQVRNARDQVSLDLAMDCV